MKHLLIGAVLFLPVVAFAGGSHETNYEKKTVNTPPVVTTPVVPTQPAAPSQPNSPATTNPPVNGGGWDGGCSTYADGQLPPWGKVPCVPTNPSQGPPVTPQSLNKPPVAIVIPVTPTPVKPTPVVKPPVPFVPLSDLPNTGLSLTPLEYLWYLLTAWW